MADTDARKRKSHPGQQNADSNKRAKGKKQWDVPRRGAVDARGIQPGDVGIWATCTLKKEAPSVTDLRDLFREYASQMYGVNQPDGGAEAEQPDHEDGDIESEIQKEIEGIRKPALDPLFNSAKLDTACLLFFKTRPPVEPVSFVRKICLDAGSGVELKRCRFVRRLTPITATEKATERGLEDVARRVLAPHFHQPDQEGKKFAIRVSIRNNKQFTRDQVIKTIAAAVGKGHKVDLAGYDLLILVEIYQNVLGMSVVGPDFDKLKRFNLAELRDLSNDNSKAAIRTTDEAPITGTLVPKSGVKDESVDH